MPPPPARRVSRATAPQGPPPAKRTRRIVPSKGSPPTTDPIHMLKEISHKDGRMKPILTTLCRREGAPYGMRHPKGLRSTVWAAWVTCEDCAKEPSIVKYRMAYRDDVEAE